MGSTLGEFRDLFFALRDQEHPGDGEELVGSWLEARPQLVTELHELGRPASRRVRIPPDPRCVTALEGLYALSRVIDVLVAPHQPTRTPPDDEPWEATAVAASVWRSFRATIGTVPVTVPEFHPFFHEIVSVEASDDPDEPPSVIGEYWPGAIVGSLLLARAGVAIRAGAAFCDPEVAAHSCLYWAWWRRNRDSADLSHGWGHNSQWRTDFRRDYVTEGHLYYNVDATPGSRPPELAEADRLDLLRHRCSVRKDLGDDEWPWDESLVEAAP